MSEEDYSGSEIEEEVFEPINKDFEYDKDQGDAITGLCKNHIQNMIRYYGGRMGSDGTVFETVRRYASDYLDQVVKESVILVEHDRRKTIQFKDVVYSLKRVGQIFYGDADSLKKYKHEIYHSEIIYFFSHAPFERLVKQVAMDHTDQKLRFEEGAIYLFQFGLESFLGDLIAKTSMICAHNNKKRITSKDLELAFEICWDGFRGRPPVQPAYDDRQLKPHAELEVRLLSKEKFVEYLKGKYKIVVKANRRISPPKPE